MKPLVAILLLVTAAGLCTSCSDDAVSNDPNAVQIVADQQYYPTEEGTFWLYRFDTTGATGPTVKDVYRRKSTMKGIYNFNGVEYAVQENETIRQLENTFDTVFVRKDDSGVYATSFALQSASLFPGFGGIPLDIPKEILLIPDDPAPGAQWDLFIFEYAPFPFVEFYIRVRATFQGVETVPTDSRVFKNSARIRFTLNARLPNPQNPLDFGNPIVINEQGSFWFIKPGGLISGDGSQIIFDFLEGSFAGLLAGTERRVHQEVISMDIVQPEGLCIYRNTGN